jgi:NADPH:quinone reductase-like Zn-dependent oxidoreductase
MARSTFAGPILAGNSRFGPVRDVGYTDLVQDCSIVLTNSTAATAGYAGGSGQFVNGNLIPNVNGTVYTRSATAYPPTAATITADSGTGGSGTLYRGIVFYVPVGSNINDFLIDTNVAITATGGTIGTVSVQIGNAFNDTTYGSITSANASAARNTIVQTGAELLATNSTTVDFTNPNGVIEPATFSQVVVTFTIPYTGGSGTTLPTITAGTFTAAMRYTQLDTNIGTATAYPYGNFE